MSQMKQAGARRDHGEHEAEQDEPSLNTLVLFLNIESRVQPKLSHQTPLGSELF
jgi:hypothetical protein